MFSKMKIKKPNCYNNFCLTDKKISVQLKDYKKTKKSIEGQWQGSCQSQKTSLKFQGHQEGKECLILTSTELDFVCKRFIKYWKRREKVVVVGSYMDKSWMKQNEADDFDVQFILPYSLKCKWSWWN